MTFMNAAMLAERSMPVLLFALYLLTSVRLCRYGTWLDRGAPNPFLPRRLKPVVTRYQRELRLQNLPLA